MAKKVVKMLVLVGVIAMMLAISAYAADSVDVAFTKGGQDLYEIESGNLRVVYKLTSESAKGNVNFLAAVIENGRLKDISLSAANAAAGTTCGYADVKVEDASKEIVKAMVWDSNFSPLCDAAVLNNVNTDTGLHLTVQYGGKDYKAVRCSSGNDYTVYLNGVPEDLSAIDTVVDTSNGSKVTPASGKVDFCEPVTYTVTSESGEKETYSVTLTEGMITAWAEDFTGSEITGATGETSAKFQANTRYGNSSFVPTNGSWNGGQWAEYEYGKWQPVGSQRTQNLNPVLTIVNNEDEHGDVLRLNAYPGGYGELYYRPRVPEAAPSYVPDIHDKVVTEYDLRYTVLGYDNVGEMQAGMIYFTDGAAVQWDIRNGPDTENYTVCFGNASNPAVHIVPETFRINDWHHYRIVSQRSTGKIINSYYIDDKFIGTSDYIGTGTGELYFEYYAMQFYNISTTYGEREIDNIKVLYR